MANEVLYGATRGISDLILMPGVINLDFADVKTTMLDGGAAIMGSAIASGPDRAEIAARAAISSPLLDGVSIRGARNVLVNISGSEGLALREINLATSVINLEAGEDAEIIMGTVLDNEYGDELRVTVIATGFEVTSSHQGTKVTSSRKNMDSSPSKPMPAVPKVSIPTIESIGTRVPSRRSNEFYRGENNLKKMDVPSFIRKAPTTPLHEETEQESQPFGLNRSRQVSGMPRNTLLNGHSERIDKSDSEQPAFLRRMMD